MHVKKVYSMKITLDNIFVKNRNELVRLGFHEKSFNGMFDIAGHSNVDLFSLRSVYNEESTVNTNKITNEFEIEFSGTWDLLSQNDIYASINISEKRYISDEVAKLINQMVNDEQVYIIGFKVPTTIKQDNYLIKTNMVEQDCSEIDNKSAFFYAQQAQHSQQQFNYTNLYNVINDSNEYMHVVKTRDDIIKLFNEPHEISNRTNVFEYNWHTNKEAPYKLITAYVTAENLIECCYGLFETCKMFERYKKQYKIQHISDAEDEAETVDVDKSHKPVLYDKWLKYHPKPDLNKAKEILKNYMYDSLDSLDKWYE